MVFGPLSHLGIEGVVGRVAHDQEVGTGRPGVIAPGGFVDSLDLGAGVQEAGMALLGARTGAHEEHGVVMKIEAKTEGWASCHFWC